MNRPLHILLRLLRVALGLALSLWVAAAVVLVVDLNKGHVPDLLAGVAAAGLVAYQGLPLLLPLAVVAILAEILRWRSIAMSLAAGLAAGAVTLALAWLQAPVEPPDPILGEEPVLTAAKIVAALAGGLLGGLVYWLIAGRSAGFTPTERPKP